MPAFEDEHAAARELVGDVCGLPRVVVVVAENRDNRHLKPVAGVGEHGCLLGQAVRCEVARQHDEIALLGRRLERPDEVFAERLDRVHVARGRDANRGRHLPWVPANRVP